MRFYTHSVVRGNNVLIRGYDNGRRFVDRVPYRPTVYIPSRKRGEFKTIDGQYVESFEPGTIKDTREFYEKYDDVENFKVYGSNLHAYACLNENFGNDYDMDVIKVANIDIEVASEDGFPEPDLANQPITAITVGLNGHYYVFGVGEYANSRQDNVSYVDCKGERRLISLFLDFWEKMDADIVTGWNVMFFDIPYLYHRISRTIGESEANRLAPHKYAIKRTVKTLNREQTAYDLVGLAILDYLELYKKFTYSQQESYRLDHIAFVEVGEKKLDYSEVETLHQLYKIDYQKFIDYNIKDVQLVDRIDDKMKLIEMAMAIAYDAKVNYSDVFTQVRMWDVLIHNHLMSKKIVIPPKKSSSKNSKYAGAYVKDPQVGMHQWVMSFDLNSLYPHLIMQYNISPDTFIEGEYEDITVDEILSGKTSIKFDSVMAANGYYYDRTRQGFLPEMMERMYNERVQYKKKMIEAEKELEEINRMLKEL